jgi:hypothetical protein
MKKQLSTADWIAKLALSITTILSYWLQLISGPFAEVLLILSLGVLIIIVIKVIAAGSVS